MQYDYLSHETIWAALDRLAQHRGLSPSALARRAGLDPTAFNRSKRHTKEGRPRWPSTESISKVLSATETSFDHFSRLISSQNTSGPLSNDNLQMPTRLPFLPLKDCARQGLFDDQGNPVSNSWEETTLPNVDTPHLFIVEVDDGTLEPVYREGDLLIISPQSDLRKGDRVLVRLHDGTLFGKTLGRRTMQHIELIDFVSQEAKKVSIEGVAWVSRIVWASQ